MRRAALIGLTALGATVLLLLLYYVGQAPPRPPAPAVQASPQPPAPTVQAPPQLAAETRGSESREVEPNDDILKANAIPLNATVRAEVSSPSDIDFFTFTMPGIRRNYIDVVLNNDSTTLAPQIYVHNPDKSELGYKYNSTLGGDVSYSFVAQPNSRYYVRVLSVHGYGKYVLTVRPE